MDKLLQRQIKAKCTIHRQIARYIICHTTPKVNWFREHNTRLSNERDPLYGNYMPIK